jgi:hypothetical protein
MLLRQRINNDCKYCRTKGTLAQEGCVMAGRAKRNTILNKHQFGLETDKNSEEGGGGT